MAPVRLLHNAIFGIQPQRQFVSRHPLCGAVCPVVCGQGQDDSAGRCRQFAPDVMSKGCWRNLRTSLKHDFGHGGPTTSLTAVCCAGMRAGFASRLLGGKCRSSPSANVFSHTSIVPGSRANDSATQATGHPCANNDTACHSSYPRGAGAGHIRDRTVFASSCQRSSPADICPFIAYRTGRSECRDTLHHLAVTLPVSFRYPSRVFWCCS